MSPGVPSRIAELGSDPHRLAEAFHRSLVKADAIAHMSASSASLAAVMQAIAIQTLAVNVGRLVEVIEADNASARTLSMPVATPPQDARCPRCGHTCGFGAGCNFPDGGPSGVRCGCDNRFHTDGAR